MRANQVSVSILLLLTLTTAGCGGSPSAKTRTEPDTTLTAVFMKTMGSRWLAVNGTLQLQAFGAYANPVSKQDVTNTATWATSDPAVATVNQGVVTAIKDGPATISATFGSKTDSINIVVGLTPIIDITPKGPFSRSLNRNQYFIAMESFPDGSTLDVTALASWSSSPAGVLTFYIYDEGDATFVSAGTTTIAATLSTGEMGSLTVTVVP